MTINDSDPIYDTHAYVLMTNHVHLLVTPNQTDGIARMMQSVGRRYVQYVNYCNKRSGTLWEGRYKASLVQSERYLLVCSRYIELNPVRAGMVTRPEAYRWSSYRANALGEETPLLTPHPMYAALGVSEDDRSAAYRALYSVQLNPEMLTAVRMAVNQETMVGENRFKAEIEAALNRRIQPLPRGRPRKEKEMGRMTEGSNDRFAIIGGDK